jgi:hypothetical protein
VLAFSLHGTLGQVDATLLPHERPVAMKAQHRKLDTRKALFIHCPQPLQRGLMALMGSIPSLAIDGMAVADDDWKEVLRQYPDSLVFVFSSNNCELEAMVRSIRRVNRRLPCLAITKSAAKPFIAPGPMRWCCTVRWRRWWLKQSLRWRGADRCHLPAHHCPSTRCRPLPLSLLFVPVFVPVVFVSPASWLQFT